MGTTSSKIPCVMANRYHKTIWVKHDVEKKHVQVEDYSIKGQVGVGGLTVGAGVSVGKKYDWVKIESQFTPIPSNEYIDPVVNCRDSNLIYLTIIDNDEKIICNTYGTYDKNMLVTEKGLLRAADPKNIWVEHPRHARFNQNKPTISNISANGSRSVDIKDKGDSKECSISGSAVTYNGTQLLADSANKNIKSMSSVGNLLSILQLPASPKAITVLDPKTAVVAGEDKKLYILDITDHTKLSIRFQNQLKYGISAMTNYYTKLVVSCETDPWCIKMITIHTDEVWTTTRAESGRNSFASTAGINTTTLNGKDFILVADKLKNTITFLEAETGKFTKTIDMPGQEPRGLAVDQYNNVFVCQYKTGQVCVWTNDFNMSKILLSGVEGLSRISYSSVDSTLCISYDDKNTVDYIQLSTEQQPTSSKRRYISQLTATRSGSLNVRHRDDEDDCFILELAVTKSGTLLVMDKNNKKIKSVSPDGNISYFCFPTKPTAITVLDTKTAVVTGEDKMLYILDITNPTKLSVRRKCQLEYNISSMTNYNGKLAVICFTDIYRYIRMITINEGKEIWLVSKNESGEYLHNSTDRITTTTVNDTAVIVFNDFCNDTLTLLEAETGRIMSTIRLKSVYVNRIDIDGNVYVCYLSNREIGVWSNDFEKSTVLLSRNDLEGNPRSVVYNDVNDSLYVTYSSSSYETNIVDCFKLSTM